ncbi:SdrD B-like domain-containing protein [Microbacterium sp. CPCC 204701]|uniref:SdrD B-like domain-containing protein n=1 Tax=Microbacterium sp. CPCC 204701 TaxID=2493084 RepID=UPI000FDC0B24|nr:SdrD B-like domain-containing protein [Microbacterium sp. CPCC 204701]
MLGGFVALLLAASTVIVGVTPASAATYTLTATRANSGISAADAPATCSTQGSTATAHCPGQDVSLSAADQILRTGDIAHVRFGFAFDGADTGVVLRSTLPEANGGPIAIWTSIPPACASGSTRTDNLRTLNCLIANPQGAGDGSVTAFIGLQGYAFDGYTFTVTGTIESASSAPVAAASTATFTSSSAPLWNLQKNFIANVLPSPFFYRGPGGEPGFAIPTSSQVAPGKNAGAYSPLPSGVAWSESMSSPTIDTSGYRLLNWGNYGQDGCGPDRAAASPAVPAYTSVPVSVSNQYNPVPGATFDCTQPGGPGTPVQVTMNTPPVIAGGFDAGVWIMMWVPLAAVPAGTTTAPTVTASGFDPVDVNGVSNYLDSTEPTNNNAAAHGVIINDDNRAIAKRPIADVANPYAAAFPNAIGTTTRGGSFVSLVRFQNTGTVLQNDVQVCDVFDVTTQRISPFTANAAVPADTYVVATTQGPIGDPITAPPFEPGAGYNNTNNFAVDPGSYVVEFAAGDLGGATPTEAPAQQTALEDAGCGDADTTTGWHTDPNDPAIAAYAATLGLSDPFDVINRVRVTFVGDVIEPNMVVGVKFHLTARSVYRDASTQAGQTIYATTRLGDVAGHEYPESTVDPWTKAPYTGPVIAGRIDVDTAVDVLSVTPSTVQAGAPGQNRATYTLRGAVGFGENVATTQPLRIVYHLPAGMRYVGGSATVTPEHVLPQPSGATVIVWDFGDITGTTNGVTQTDPFSFTAEADPLAPTPSVNWSTMIAESVSPTGEQIDTDPPLTACGTFPEFSIPPTSNVPVETVTQIPAPADYGGCFSQGRNRRSDYVGVTIGNAFLSLASFKEALSTVVESGADDGVAGAQVGWNLTYANTTSNDFPGVDIVDVLPYPGDGRDPESDFSGTIALTGLTSTDALSGTPNELPVSEAFQPPRNGTTFYVTDRVPTDIERDPYAASNLQGGATVWCVLADLGDPGCPATLADATAVRVISGLLRTGEEETVRLGFATDGAEAGQRMTNTAVARVITVITPVEISGDAVEFAASSISGTVWEDANADGTIGGGESVRLAGVTVTLTGTATASGEVVNRSAVTDADGAYTIPGLPAGTFTVTVDQASARAVDAAYALTADPDGTTAPDGSFEVTLPLGTDVTARDFGFATSSLAGTVFGDRDNDGAIDADEDGVGGVEVTLTGTDDLGQAVSVTTTTSGTGAYSFPGIRPGDYQLAIAPPPGTLGGRNVVGSAGGTAGDVGSNAITAIPLAAGENGVGYLFGLFEPEVIEGIVFEDLDGDGTQDPGEPGIPGVTITLSGDADLTTTTLGDGRFVFAGLAPGTYEITETQPTGYLDGTTATNGSEGSVSGDTITGIAVGPTADTDGYTFAELPPASLTGIVFHDVNANGVQDAGEPGIPGAEVTLSGAADVGPVVTDADGAYSFGMLRPGTYTVTATEAPGYVDGLETAGSAGGTVDNTSAASGDITGIDLTVGQAATAYLFGDFESSSIAGVVYEDTDGDGARAPGEPGIDGVAVTLTGTDAFGAAVNLTTATVAGDYSFPVLPGTYTITETQPVDYFDGSDSAGSAGGTVGDDVVSGIVMQSGVAATGYLFGERAPVSLSGLVFEDLDGDAVHDAAEDGVAGVTLTLRDMTDATVGTTVTAADGTWSFEGIAPGTYSVVEEGQPLAGFIDGASIAGTAGGTAAANRIDDVVLTASADGYLFAEIPLSIIRGIVWHDANDDGVQDAGEAPIAGVEIALSGSQNRTTVTAADGSFVFGGLEPGTYTITEEDLDNWSDGATVTGAAGGTAATNAVTGIVLGAGQDASGYGFGERAADLQIVVATQTLDAQTAPGPYVAVGDPVRWTYRVINNGDTELDEILVTDSVAGTVTCPATVLAPHSEFVCVLDGTAVAGQYENLGTVAARVVPRDSGGPTVLAVTERTASDVSHYFGAELSAEIVATVDGEDAGNAPGPVFPNGTELTLRVVIRNAGNVPLTMDSLDRGSLGALDCGSMVTLAPEDSVTCELTWTPSAGNYAFPIMALLNGPPTTDVAGQTTDAPVEPASTVFFQVLEPGLTPPSAVADTGATLDPRILVVSVAMLLAGSGLLIAARLRRRPTWT